MNFYPFHIGDYHAHTGHLEPLEDLAYRRMLDYCFLHESGLPETIEEIARVIRMRSHCECIAVALLEFFEQHSDGTWHNDRVDAEIAKYREKSDKASNSARKRWKNTDANALPTHSERNANHNQEPEPITNNQKNKPQAAKADKSASTVTQDHLVTVHAVDPQVAVDYLAIRKAKRAPLTATAFAKLQAEFDKAGLSVPDGIRLCAERGWQGFEAKWLTNGGQTKADDRAAKLEEARRRSQERTGGIRDVTPRSVGNA